MNVNALVNMVVAIFVRQIVNRGINVGIDKMSSGGKRRDEMTPEERKNAQQTKDAAHRARRTMRMGRRLF